MIFRKLVSTLVIAGMMYWAPSVVPAVHLNQQARASCISMFTTWDTAFALPPCLAAAPSNSIHPWPVVVLIGSVVSIMFNAAIVWNTQCRELTIDEALTAGALPGIGIAINQNKGPKSACHTH